MATHLIERAPNAYDYPLLVRHLLATTAPEGQGQDIVYRDLRRYSYDTLHQRVGQLASGLASLDIKPGDEAIHSYEGTREINTLIVGCAVTGLSAFV